MQDVVNWLVNNWQFVSSAAISIISFILLLIFRKNKCFTQVIFDSYAEVVSLTQAAEAKYGAGNGALKQAYVIEYFMKAHPDFNVFKLIDIIDDVLSSPEKKKGCN